MTEIITVMGFNIAVLASTNGTDLQAIIDEMEQGLMAGIELKVVVSNVEDCGALERAKRHGVESVFVDPKGKSREDYDQELVDILRVYDIDLVVLVGYMKILTSVFLREFRGKVINVHPSLIPKYSGKSFYGNSVHEAVLAAKDEVTGMTIHYVDEEVDGGEIILQKECPVFADDTVESLKERVQGLEKKWYPEVIRMLSRKI